MPVEGISLGNPLEMLFSAATTECLFSRFLIFEAVVNSLLINCCNLLTKQYGAIIVIHEVFEVLPISGKVNDIFCLIIYTISNSFFNGNNIYNELYGRN